MEPKLKVMTMKHRNGFAPNFIHSLDSSHMMLTSIHLWHAGVTFASVHDCFWTHAADVERMNATCREQFVALHSFPILDNLSQSFIDKFLLVARTPAMLEEEEKFRFVAIKFFLGVRIRIRRFFGVDQTDPHPDFYF